jgi:signal transduction histidine kinase
MITVKAELIRNPDARPGEEWVAISITDTGIGIREEDLPKLFCSFVRLSLPEDMQVKGTGLGLYLVKKITTDVLGGTVNATSVYGRGSEFRLTVPVR